MDIVKQLVEERPDFFANRPAWLERAVPINDFIYMSYGLSNAYMLCTTAGRVIINTGMGFEAPTHKRVFDAVQEGPTPYIILTQGHVDHVGGVQLFREPGTQLIAQRNNAICQADDERIRGVRLSQASIWLKAWIDAMVAAGTASGRPPVQDVPVPDVTFEDAHHLTVGDLAIELYATPGGETIDSCVLWLPKERIEHLLRGCVRDRAKFDAAVSLDVMFHEFMADPMATLERVYARIGMPLDQATQTRLQAYLADHPRGKDGQVRYHLTQDFGVTATELRARFGFYLERYPIKIEVI